MGPANNIFHCIIIILFYLFFGPESFIFNFYLSNIDFLNIIKDFWTSSLLLQLHILYCMNFG